MKTIILILIIAGTWYYLYDIKTVPSTSEGITAYAGPYQESTDAKSFEFKGVILTPKENFYLIAKVLSAERYHFDRYSKLATLDLVLGWQNLSDNIISNQVEFSQANRQYQWQTNTQDISDQEIKITSANIHLIPATEEIKQQIKQIKIGQLIDLNGQLVDVKTPSSWEWETSLTQTDMGKNSSEILYVTSLKIIE